MSADRKYHYSDVNHNEICVCGKRFGVHLGDTAECPSPGVFRQAALSESVDAAALACAKEIYKFQSMAPFRDPLAEQPIKDLATIIAKYRPQGLSRKEG